MTPRDCDDTVTRGRLKKAKQFAEAAEVVGALADDETDVRDAVVTLLVHAGIAASDVICCKRLGQFAIGADSHDEVAKLLEKVREPDGEQLSKELSKLLKVKTKAGYTHRAVSNDDLKKARRAAGKLLQAAREI